MVQSWEEESQKPLETSREHKQEYLQPKLIGRWPEKLKHTNKEKVSLDCRMREKEKEKKRGSRTIGAHFQIRGYVIQIKKKITEVIELLQIIKLWSHSYSSM